MKPEDIDRELESLWNRVHSGGEGTPAGSAPAPAFSAAESALSVGDVARSAALDSVRILKARHREAERRFEDQLASKDRELQALRERLQEAELRLSGARREVQEREQETTAIVLQTRVWAEEQTKILSEMRDGHQIELARVKEEEGRLHERLTLEGQERERLSAAFKKREQEMKAQVAALESARAQAQKELEGVSAAAKAETQAVREQLKLDAEAAAASLRSELETLREELKHEKEGAASRVQTQMREAAERFQEELRQREAKLAEINTLLDSERRQAQQRAEEFLRSVRETVGKLLVESTAHEEVQETNAALERDLKASREEAERMKAAWAEERKQWAELWERETATRESRREELKRWETELRRERESLLRGVKEERRAAGLPAIEAPAAAATEIKAAPQTPPARAAAAVSEPAPSPLEASAPLSAPSEAPSAPQRPAPVEEEPQAPRAPLRVPGWAVGLVLAAAAAAGVAVWHSASTRGRIALSFESVSPLAAQGPLSLAWDGSRLLVGTSEGRVLLFDQKDLSKPLGAALPKNLLPYRPASMAFGDGSLWTLDTAQMRLLRHDPRNLNRVLWRFGEGSLPTAITHDGKRLWAFDAGNRRLVMFHADPAAGVEQAYDAPATLGVSAMQWQGPDLWLYNARSGELLRARPEQGKLNILNRQTLEPGVITTAVTDSEVLELVKDGEHIELRRLHRVYPQ